MRILVMNAGSSTLKWTLLYDALLRAAAAKHEVEGIEAAVDDIAAALEEVPAAVELMSFVEPLLDAGFDRLAGAILDERLAREPDDADAHAL
jgi:acetate kinase